VRTWSARALASQLRLDKIKPVVSTYRGSASVRHFLRGYSYGRHIPPPEDHLPERPQAANALGTYFDANTRGPVINKWLHYFEIYDRHLSRFRGKPVSVVEIGVAGGGSLYMWRDYLGPDSRVYGIDIDPDCKRFEAPGIEILIGDQGNRAFWQSFLSRCPQIDVVIDDGSHEPIHQAITLELLLPHIQPGGVYICEDIHGPFQPFHSFVDGLTRCLSEIWEPWCHNAATSLQRQVASVHHYPILTVIEKATWCAPTFEAEAKGSDRSSDWQPPPIAVQSATGE
jgi:23S rRNA U2552 (ribose-2'-O)-methylase RlmE/FtsJ